MDETTAVKAFASALRLAERAHAQAELAGYKGEWPEFYAQWLMDNVHLWTVTSHHHCEDDTCAVHP